MNQYGDYASAFEAIDLGQFFVRAIRSYLFNRVLTAIVRTTSPPEKLETVGFDTTFSKETAPIYNKVLEDEGIALSQFDLPKHPKLSVRGGYRNTIFTPQDLGITINSDSVMLSFTLPKGSYARFS